MSEAAWWYDEQESGPPTIEDDAWFQHHVVSKGYPKVKREPEQLPGQTRLTDPVDDEWPVPADWQGEHHTGQ